MGLARVIVALAASLRLVNAACPYMQNDARELPANHPPVRRDGHSALESTDEFLAKYEIDDADAYLTSDVGGPMADQNSLSAGERGPTLLEDFIFRQKITHFDHERVPERAVHARGAGAHGVFVSYADWSNITGASFLAQEGKETPIFMRFSTVAGSRGSADTVRDVHGFAVRFYTDEGNFDIVGNNIPIFFIQDAILFPDLIHAVKPRPDREMPQAATAHDTAWDFFSQQPSALHTLFWAMHMDGFGIHTFRFVTDAGQTKLVKFRFRSLQGKASLVWEEAQVTAGKNADYHRQDLWDSIEKNRYPEWVFEAQIMEESDQLRFGFDLLDPTKIVPEELVPFTPLGKLTLNRNPRNYFAETEQIMFQPGHIVRGIDVTDDPLLQGRLFSYLDTQLNRHGGPNFEQLPINQPRVPWHNNNRDGQGQMFIPLNTAAYSPNTLNNGFPRQANQTTGRGFFTAPSRSASGKLMRTVSSTFADAWSQPRLFFNSLPPAQQQFVVNAMRFEMSMVQSPIVKDNVLIQLNRIRNDVAVRVGAALGLSAPEPDPTFYHDNTTVNVSPQTQLLKLDGLKVGFLTSVKTNISDAETLKSSLADLNVDLVVVAESLNDGVDQTYLGSDASNFDAVIASAGAIKLFSSADEANSTYGPSSTLYPAGRPREILENAYKWGKPVGSIGAKNSVLGAVKIKQNSPGVYETEDSATLVGNLKDGLATFKFLDRFPVDQ
ncbi:catalase [Lojkania enalia]|uniref:Catalase n=1 Tax=Lojkania enalia TaxID=147567 RepID=A0A9P4N6E3_9PLEO|nr:catalase [Didymosphaeria enalia]